MINMIGVRIGQIIDFGFVKLKAVKELDKRSCKGCYFNKVTESFSSCSRYIKNCPSSKLIFIQE